MFHKIAVVLFCLVIGGYCASVKLPDQTQQKLAKLQEVLQSAIPAGESQLEEAKINFNIYFYNVFNKTNVELKDETKRIDGLLNDIKTLSVGIDIDSCLSVDEAYLTSLPDDIEGKLNSCFNDIVEQVNNQIYISNNSIRDTMKTADDLSKKLALCTSGSIICVSPVLRSIEAATIELPETIDKIVHQATLLIDVLTPEVDGCRGTNVASYTSTAQGVLDEINDCINNL